MLDLEIIFLIYNIVFGTEYTISGGNSRFYYNYNILRANLQVPKVEEVKTYVTKQFETYKIFLDDMHKVATSTLLLPQFKLLEDEQFHKLICYLQTKSKQQISKVTEVYNSSVDELKGTKVWEKINGKKNLLMVFQSANATIFGGYSPCIWLSTLNNYVPDETLTSFLFSQTHNEIYPLKENQKQSAIYCGEDSSLRFGQDIHILDDFKGGSSNLGSSYQWDDYKNENRDYLFGGLIPSIEQCEIYQLTLE